MEGTRQLSPSELPKHLPASYYSDEAIGKERVKDISKFEKINGPIFLEEPNVEDVVQSVLGNCYFLATLKAVLRRYPEFIREILQEELSKTDPKVLSKFYIKSEESSYIPTYYKMDKSIVRNLLNILIPGHKANWVFLLEKAFFIHRLHNRKYIEDIKDDQKNPQQLSFNEVITSGRSTEAIEALLGCAAQGIKINPYETLETLININPFNPDIGKLKKIFKDDDFLNKFLLNLLSSSLFDFTQQRVKEEIKNNKNVPTVTMLKDFYNSILEKDIMNILEITVIKQMNPRLGERKYSLDAKYTYNLILEKLKSGEIVCVSTKSEFENKEKAKGLVRGHVYEIINCYIRNGRPTLLLANPWQREVRGFQIIKSASNETDLFYPIAQKNKLFGKQSRAKQDKARTEKENDIQDLAITAKNYHPDALLDHEGGTFEIDINDLMEFFSDINFSDIKKTLDKNYELKNQLDKKCRETKNEIMVIRNKVAKKLAKEREKDNKKINSKKKIRARAIIPEEEFLNQADEKIAKLEKQLDEYMFLHSELEHSIALLKKVNLVAEKKSEQHFPFINPKSL